MNKLSVVIPCYNERANIEEILRRVCAAGLPAGWEKEVIVVDDCSTDGTRDILRASALPIRVFYQDKNGGKGSALHRGFTEATGSHIIIQDADLEYDPAEIRSLVEMLSDATPVVYGSRNLHHAPRSGFFVQRAGVWFITALINTLYRVQLTDVWTCYKLFPRAAAPMLRPGRFESELLFTTALLRAGYAIGEGAISHYPRDAAHGKKIRYRDGVHAILALALDYLAHLRSPEAYRAKDVSVILNGEYPRDAQGRVLAMGAGAAEGFEEEHQSGVNWLKSFLKQFPALYYGVWGVFCPVMMVVNGPRRVFRYLPADKAVLDVGSGPERLGPEFINVDVMPFPQVDVVADAASLPFKTGSLAGVVSESVLEHVPDMEAVAKEMVRVLAQGGVLYASIPFIHPFHASPDDFNRLTTSGLKRLFRELEPLEVGVRSGPWSAFLILLAYWFGVIFSFGSRKAAPFLAHVFMLVLGPLKIFDLLFVYLPGAEVVATHVYFIGKKR